MVGYIMSYAVTVPSIVKRDVSRAINRKREFGAYERNIIDFKSEVDKKISSLVHSPKIGANLSSRVNRETKIKYHVIDDYLLFYEINEPNQVDVIRFLSAKSNWILKLF